MRRKYVAADHSCSLEVCHLVSYLLFYVGVRLVSRATNPLGTIRSKLGSSPKRGMAVGFGECAYTILELIGWFGCGSISNWSAITDCGGGNYVAGGAQRMFRTCAAPRF
jgi:hypothetical protein